MSAESPIAGGERELKEAEYAESLSEVWDANAVKDPMYAILSGRKKKAGAWNKDEFFRTGETEVADLAQLLD